MRTIISIILSIFLYCNVGFCLEPNEILIIVNGDISQSVRLAEYYCEKRKIPADNIVTLSLGSTLKDSISRQDYEKKLAVPIRSKLYSPAFAGKIRCLLTTYGVPFKAGGRGHLKNSEQILKQLLKQQQEQKNKLTQLELITSPQAERQKKKINANLARLKAAIDPIVGEETAACVDSELSMVLFEKYELYRWHRNKLNLKMPFWDYKSLMVSRLDGPSAGIAARLIDKALAAEKTGLKGKAYIDSGHSITQKGKALFKKYDQSLQDTAAMIKTRTDMPVVEERTSALFAPGQCPQTALYCGWYSLKNYIDAFDFVDGAIGYHIASWEAIDLRDPASRQWCPAMLVDGITATLGAVAEPYLSAIPEPKPFFEELLDGHCLAEAFYRTKLYNSWQMILIGDPLYTPFKITASGHLPESASN